MTTAPLYDRYHTRYRCIKQAPEEHAHNWLFFPGGPGGDSNYLLDLVNDLAIDGNIWLVDLPTNGSNTLENSNEDYDFEQWSECFLHAIGSFSNTICVGHSFGGMLPLLFPQLETMLSGLVILNSAPSQWTEEAAKYAKANNIPSIDGPMQAFIENPNDQTLTTALMACAPYYFAPPHLERGKKTLEKMAINFNYNAPIWWLQKTHQTPFDAQWIPQKVPTMIIGGGQDCMCPISLFEQDKRFIRDNIELKKLENAGHIPWVENMAWVAQCFHAFSLRIEAHATQSAIEG